MKKLLFLFGLLLFTTVGLLAQDIDPPSDVFDLVGNFQLYMGTLGGVAVVALFVTGLINGLLQVTAKWLRLLISWGVPIIITVVFGSLLNIGFLAEVPWWLAALYGLGAGLIANRGYDVKTIQQIILFIETLLGNKTIKLNK